MYKTYLLFLTMLVLSNIISSQSSFFRDYGQDYPGSSFSLTLTSDQGYALTGRSSGLRILRVDSEGEVVWHNSFEGIHGNSGSSIIEVAGGNLLVAGTQGKPDTFGHGYAAAYTVKTDALGDSLWTFVWDENPLNRSEIVSLLQPNDSTYILAGTTGAQANSTVFSKAFLIAIDNDGNERWATIYDDQTHLFSAVKTFDDGYLIGGLYGSIYNTFNEPYIAKTDMEGNVLWERRSEWNLYAGRIQSLLQLESGDIIVCGTATASDLKTNAFTSKLDSDGNLIWTKQFGEAFSLEHGVKVVGNDDGGFVFAGFTSNNTTGEFDQYDILLIRLDSEGEIVWERSYGTEQTDIVTDMIKHPDGSFVMTGYNLPSNDAFLVKTDSLGQVDFFTSTRNFAPDNVEGIASFPNPVVNTLYLNLPNSSNEESREISYIIVNVLGTIVKKRERSIIEDTRKGLLKIDVSKLEKGTYFINVHKNGHSYLTKFVKQ